MSKRRSNTTKRRDSPPPRVFVDRGLGRYKLIDAVRSAFSDIVPHDNIFHQKVRDPEWLYCCGKLRWVVVTSDKDIFQLPPHRAAIKLARVVVFCFAKNNRSVDGRAKALKRAKPAILRYFRRHCLKRHEEFMGQIALRWRDSASQNKSEQEAQAKPGGHR